MQESDIMDMQPVGPLAGKKHKRQAVTESGTPWASAGAPEPADYDEA